MKISDLINDDLTVNWEVVETIKEFKDLQSTPHSLRWHKEGNPLNHTKLVVEKLTELLKEEKDNFADSEMQELIAAALCHDLGKATTTRFDEEANDYKCMNHGSVGSQITRRLLSDEEPGRRERVCWLVRWHMSLHHILDKPEGMERTAIKMSCGFVHDSFHKIWLLTKADSLGSVNEETDEFVIDKFNRIREYAEKLGCFDTPYDFRQHKERIEFFQRHMDSVAELAKIEIPSDSNRALVHIYVGLPGSGKDTLIKTLLDNWDTYKLPKKNVTVLCRDDIRTEIGIEGEKPQGNKEQEDRVTEILNERYLKALDNGDFIIINNTNLRKKYRAEFIKTAMEHNAFDVQIVWVDTPLEMCKKRREGQISPSVIDRMAANMECPEPTEVSRIMIFKGYEDEVG